MVVEAARLTVHMRQGGCCRPYNPATTEQQRHLGCGCTMYWGLAETQSGLHECKSCCTAYSRVKRTIKWFYTRFELNHMITPNTIPHSLPRWTRLLVHPMHVSTRTTLLCKKIRLLSITSSFITNPLFPSQLPHHPPSFNLNPSTSPTHKLPTNTPPPPSIHPKLRYLHITQHHPPASTANETPLSVSVRETGGRQSALSWGCWICR